MEKEVDFGVHRTSLERCLFLLKQRSLENNIVLGCGGSAFGFLYVSIALDLEAVYRGWGWDRWTGVTLTLFF